MIQGEHKYKETSVKNHLKSIHLFPYNICIFHGFKYKKKKNNRESNCIIILGRELEGGAFLGIYEIMFFRFFYVYNLWNSPVYRLILVATGHIWKLFKG